MENFIVSARKYRPKQFEEVVGQGHVTRTLENAIANNHLAQALLFTGPRGVGKTTCARILAKVINSDGAVDENQDFSFNIIELDAASNNSVDDIRALTDQVRFAPQTGDYKVYIIDEVHMLSSAAFNAFLKTLEEPPKHAIFILATTEKHKIIPTILSRCQIFDFKRISVDDIAKHLQAVAEKEGITAEPEALYTIATKADGALRDSLSIFDRIVSFSGKNITHKNVIDNLRILDYEYYFRSVDLVLANDKAGLLLLYKEILDNGFDGHLYINGLASHLRDLLVSKNPKTHSLLEVSTKVSERYHTQARQTSVNFIFEALQLCADIDYKYKGSNNQRLLVELGLMQLAELQNSGEKKKPEPKEVNKSQEEEREEEVAPKVNPEAKAEPKATQRNEPPKAEAPKADHTETTVNETPTPIPPIKQENKLPEAEEKETVAPPAKAELQEKTKPERKKGRRRGFSISEAINQNNQSEESESEVDELAPNPGLPQTEIDPKNLQALWKTYLTKLEQAGEKKLLNSIRDKNIALEGEATITLTLDNEIQQALFIEKQVNVLRFFREELNNFSVTFNIVLTQQETETVPYSPQEKYDYLAAKNPNIKLLKDRFKLDIR